MRPKTQSEVINEFESYWQGRFDYRRVSYVDADTKVEILCSLHGSFWLYSYQHKKGVGCYSCGRSEAGAKVSLRLRKSKEIFIEQAKQLHGTLYDYQEVEYKQSFIPVSVICRNHGIYQIQPSRHLEGSGCPSCSKRSSNIERRWLQSLGLPDDPRYRNVVLLPGTGAVDGFDPITQTVYEFYGDFWHGNPAIYDSTAINPVSGIRYGVLYQKTIDKENRLRAAGFQVISIWESDWKTTCRSKIYEHLPASG